MLTKGVEKYIIQFYLRDCEEPYSSAYSSSVSERAHHMLNVLIFRL